MTLTTRINEFMRYTAASAFALVVDAALLLLMVEMAGVHYLMAAAISFGAGLTSLYLLSIVWVFNERRISLPALEFTLFTLIGIGGLVLTLGVMTLAIEVWGLDYRLAKGLAVGASFFFNFSLRKWALFTRVIHVHP